MKRSHSLETYVEEAVRSIGCCKILLTLWKCIELREWERKKKSLFVSVFPWFFFSLPVVGGKVDIPCGVEWNQGAVRLGALFNNRPLGPRSDINLGSIIRWNLSWMRSKLSERAAGQQQHQQQQQQGRWRWEKDSTKNGAAAGGTDRDDRQTWGLLK